LAGCIQEAEKYPNEQKNKSILRDGIDDTRDNIYWYNMPENMEITAKYFNLTVIENLGVTFVLIPEMYNPTSERKEVWEEIVDFLCSRESCTGFASHAVMVCRKNKI